MKIQERRTLVIQIGEVMDILNEINSDPKSLSPLVLAYIGDAVFELMVRVCA